MLVTLAIAVSLLAAPRPRARDHSVGVDGHTAIGLPHDRLRAALAKYRRLVDAR